MEPNPTNEPIDVEAFRRFEREGWDRVAHLFHDVWAPLTTQFLEPLLAAAGVRAGHRVLDLACGPGYLAAAAAARGAEVVALDLSTAMAAEARRRHPGLDVRIGPAEAVDLPSASFDRVLMSFGVSHVADPIAVFREARRLLRSGGSFAFTAWAGPEESPGARLLEGTIAAHAMPASDLPRGPDSYLHASPAHAAAPLAAAGFPGLSSTLVVGAWRVPSAAVILDAELHAGVRTSALLSRQEPARLAAIAADLGAGLEAYRDGDGFALPMSAWVHVARALDAAPAGR